MSYEIREETIDDIANAIRARGGAIGDLQVQDFNDAILNIPNGENTSAAAASAAAAHASEVSAASSALAASEHASDVLTGVSTVNQKAQEVTEDAEAVEADRLAVEEAVEGFDDNVSAKTTTFNNNVTEKTNTFNSNASDKTSIFNENASDKTNAFDLNAQEKQTAVDNSVEDAEAWSVGKRNGVDVSASDETYNNNAKYWAHQAEQVSGTEDFTNSDMETIWDTVFTT